MKGKMKKVIAGIATLAMVAQFGFVLPASAEATTYYSENFESAAVADNKVDIWSVSAGATSIETDADNGNNKYLKFTQSGNGTRTVKGALPAAAQVSTKTVFEADVKMQKSGDRISSIAIADKAAKPEDHKALDSNFILKIDAPLGTNEFYINPSTTGDSVNASNELLKDAEVTTGAPGGKWVHIKAILDFDNAQDTVEITSLDKQTTYYKKMIDMPSGVSQIGSVWCVIGRSGNTFCLDNVSVRSYDDADSIGTFYTVKYTGADGTALVGGDQHEYVETGKKPVKTPASVMTTGAYKFRKWTIKDGDSTEYTSDEIKNMTISADTTFVAQFDGDPTAIEKVASMRIKTHPDLVPELPKNQGETKDYPVELEILGEWGSDLADLENYRYGNHGDLTVTWEISGLDVTVDGGVADNGEPSDPTGDFSLGDMYVTLQHFRDNSTSSNIQILNGVKNYIATFKVTVKFGNDTAGYQELTDSFDMKIIADASVPEGQLYPGSGMPYNLNNYSDAIVGRTAAGFISNSSGNHDNPDDILAGWCSWGSVGTRSFSLKKDEDGNKYFSASRGGDTNGKASAALTKNIGSQNEQIYLDTDIKFGADGDAVVLYDTSGEKKDSKDFKLSLNSSAYRAIHTTPYTMAIPFSTGAFGAITSDKIAANTWYRLRLSYDDSTQQMWYQLNELADGKTTADPEAERLGALIGKTSLIDYSNANTALPLIISYIGLVPTANSASSEVCVRNMKVYKPAMASMTVTSEETTLTIPEDDPVNTTAVNAEKNAVKVTASSKALTVSVTNKTGDAETVTAYIAGYTEGGKELVKVSAASERIVNNVTKGITITPPEDEAIKVSKLYIWNDNNEPLIEGTGFELGTDKEDVTTTLTALMKDSDGNNLSGEVVWALADEYPGVTLTPSKDNPLQATLTVSGNAIPGEITVNATAKGTTTPTKITLTGSAEAVSFTEPVTSVTIPFDETNAVVSYTAKVIDGKTAQPIDGREVTYALYDANNAEVLANTAAVSLTGNTLTVTKDAAAQIVYIRANAKNTDGDDISRSVKVSIHGLSFDFGADDVEGVRDGYTPVTLNTIYNENAEGSYGITDATGVTAGGSADSDDLDGDYLTGSSLVFKAKVPNGRDYNVTVVYAGKLKTQRIDSLATGVDRDTNTALTSKTYYVPVVNGDINLNLSNDTENGIEDVKIASVTVEMIAEKTAGDKPTWYTYGDSTTNTNARNSSSGKWQCSWGNYLDLSIKGQTITENPYPAETYNLKYNFSNTARGGKNSFDYYNGGDVDGRLFKNIRPGDIVSINGMGTNNDSSTGFEDRIDYLVRGCVQRGAKVVFATYTSDGYASNFHTDTFSFAGKRENAFTNAYRNLAEKYNYPIIELGDLMDKEITRLIQAEETDEAKLAKLNAFLDSYSDHNHYGATVGKIPADIMVAEMDKVIEGGVIAD